MGRKANTLYELFSEYTEEVINNVIDTLTTEEKDILYIRYGEDLHLLNPKEEWDNPNIKNFYYKKLLPKIKLLLKESLVQEESDKKEKMGDNDLVVNISNESFYSSLYSMNSYSTLIELLNQNISTNEICSKLNISLNELTKKLLELKNIGVVLQKKYYSNGDIKYIPISKMIDLKNSNKLNQQETIITDKFENEIKILATSDFHIGNKECRLDLIEKAFDYSVKSGIHILMVSGDLLDGTFTAGTQVIPNPYEQIKYFIQHYPQDKSILTFAVGGDHDLSILNNNYIDVATIINNYRNDVIIPGYNNSIVNIKNDKIHLFHHIDGGIKFTTDAAIRLHGHSHKYSVSNGYNGSPIDICVPSLSNILQQNPTVLELNIKFKNGLVSDLNIKQIALEPYPIVLGEYNFFKDNKEVGPILNTEDYLNKNNVVDSNQESKIKTLSQIDKFNKRYGFKY